MLEPTTPASDVRYERSDANAAAIVGFAVGLGVLILVVYLAAGWLFEVCKDSVHGEANPLSPFVAKERVSLPHDLRKMPSPRLQDDEPADLERLRRAEQARLNESGWVDAKAGVVHIPIAEAMRLLADPNFAQEHGIRVETPKKKGGS